MFLRKSVFLTLAVARDLGPLERAIGVAEGAGAVLLLSAAFTPSA